MHGGAHAHSHSHDDEPLFVRPSLKPLVLSWGLFWMNMRRHSLGRSELKKASYADGEASRITWVGAAVNLFLSISKLVAGIVGNSAAMLSDAGHSLSDLVSDALTLVTLRMSALPPDIDHPYGHGRFESVGSLGIATLLLLAGLSFGQNAFAALRAPSAAPISVLALWAAVASIVFKEVLYRATRRVGERMQSQVLIANAWHHRSDALSSVVALVGIGGSLMGWRVLDPLAGLVVAAMVAAMGVRIGADALAQLTDTADYLLVQRATKSAEKVVGVERVSEVRNRGMGGTALVDLAIQVDPLLSASAAHKVAEEVRYAVLDDGDDISEVLVHVDVSLHDASCPLQVQALHSARTPSTSRRRRATSSSTRAPRSSRCRASSSTTRRPAASPSTRSSASPTPTRAARRPPQGCEPRAPAAARRGARRLGRVALGRPRRPRRGGGGGHEQNGPGGRMNSCSM